MKRILGWLISIVLLFGKTQTLYAALPENIFLCEETQEKTQERTEEEAEEQLVTGLELEAQSAFLMEADGGQILFEKNSQEQLAPASVTKIMTLLLIFDALDSGKLHMEDSITTSEYAASMGGSQVFLEPGETQTADTMIKCISVASANDACGSFKNRGHKEKPYKTYTIKHLNNSICFKRVYRLIPVLKSIIRRFMK